MDKHLVKWAFEHVQMCQNRVLYNKTKYFRLRPTDEVSSERPKERDLKRET